MVDKSKCHRKVMDAIISGKLKRPGECSKCQKPCKPDAHHEDYNKPLEVIWLCRRCHRQIPTSGPKRKGPGIQVDISKVNVWLVDVKKMLKHINRVSQNEIEEEIPLLTNLAELENKVRY